jgi:rhodanese-related sulfurtransferase
MKNITPSELKAWLDDGARERPNLLDVREPWEVAICVLQGSQHVPMRTIPGRLAELDRDVPTIVICHHGGRSLQVARFLEHQGFDRVYNLAGGVHAWAQTVDPAMPVY